MRVSEAPCENNRKFAGKTTKSLPIRPSGVRKKTDDIPLAGVKNNHMVAGNPKTKHKVAENSHSCGDLVPCLGCLTHPLEKTRLDMLVLTQLRDRKLST
jgi:hypothetical protein